jgi:hypothetical protein
MDQRGSQCSAGRWDLPKSDGHACWSIREVVAHCEDALRSAHAQFRRLEHAMRNLLVVGVLITIAAPAIAQTGARAGAPMSHRRVRQHIFAHPDPGATPAVRFSVPGWSDEQTRRWLDNATSCEYCG